MRLYIDSNVFIYAFECETDLGHAARRAFDLIDDEKAIGVTSELTVAEVLPRPYKERNLALEQACESVFAGRPGFEIHSISTNLLRIAAKLTVNIHLRLPDALHVATAMEQACEAFMTEDARVRTPPHIRLLNLSNELFA